MAQKTMCHYCIANANKTLVWLKNKNGQPAVIRLPWCGCSLVIALKKSMGIANPYPVKEGVDYKVEVGLPVVGSKGKRAGGEY